MQPDIDAQLSSFFEDAPLPDFARVMRGYDPHQVNEHMKLRELEVRKHQEQAQALQRELAEAHRQMLEIEQPTLSGLGSRIEQLFRLAEEQAAEHIAEARSAAHDLSAAALEPAAIVREYEVEAALRDLAARPLPDGQGTPAPGSPQLAGGVVSRARPSRSRAADHRVARRQA